MYQLKITKNTDALALQHFNNVKGRLLDDINYFLSGKNRIMNKEKISILRDKPSEVHIPADTRSAFPVISVQSPVSIQCCWQS